MLPQLGMKLGGADGPRPLLTLSPPSYPAAMKIPVAANGDLVIPRQLVAELVAEPGEDCFVALDDAGTTITVTWMDPRIARAYGTLEIEGDRARIIANTRPRTKVVACRSGQAMHCDQRARSSLRLVTVRRQLRYVGTHFPKAVRGPRVHAERLSAASQSTRISEISVPSAAGRAKDLWVRSHSAGSECATPRRTTAG